MLKTKVEEKSQKRVSFAEESEKKKRPKPELPDNFMSMGNAALRFNEKTAA